MLLDQRQELGVDRRPDRAGIGAGVEVGVDLVRVGLAAGVGHVLDRHDHLEVELLAFADIDQPHLAIEPAQEATDLVEWALRGRQTDALHLAAGHMVQPLE